MDLVDGLYECTLGVNLGAVFGHAVPEKDVIDKATACKCAASYLHQWAGDSKKRREVHPFATSALCVTSDRCTFFGCLWV